MPEINFELLDFTNKFIQTHPELHNQCIWMIGEMPESGMQIADQLDAEVCGTAACVAGWGAIFAGFHQVRPYWECDSDCCDEFVYDSVVDETGRETSMCSAAQEAFGITPQQADVLFSGGNSREGIDKMVNYLHDHPDATALDLINVRDDTNWR